MPCSLDLPEIVAVVATLAALVAGAIAYQALEVARRPFLWADLSSTDDGITARIHNGGPGVALDVRAALSEPGRLRKPTAPLRTIAPGAEQPSRSRTALILGKLRDPEDIGTVVLRFSDASYRRWQVYVEFDPAAPSRKPKRVRRWPWQIWWLSSDW